MSWQSSQTSLAWGSPSKMMGLTFQTQIDDVLRQQPDNVFLPSYDEWSGGHQPLPAKFVTAQTTVGFMPRDQAVAFLDTFGAERSRTWAPSLEAGDYYLRLTQSCIRVLALGERTF
jgi:hypothetical protein